MNACGMPLALKISTVRLKPILVIPRIS